MECRLKLTNSCLELVQMYAWGPHCALKPYAVHALLHVQNYKLHFTIAHFVAETC